MPKQEQIKSTKGPMTARRLWREQLRPAVFVVTGLLAFRSAVADWYDVPTGSMKPTIVEGDRVLANKLAYDLRVPFVGWRLASWADPARSEIVVLYSPKDGTRLIKRVVAVPGDTVELRNNVLIVNGAPCGYSSLDPAAAADLPEFERAASIFATESPSGSGAHPVMVSPQVRAVRNFGPLTVPAGQYFVMGDNRDNSADSRSFGCVPRERIVARSSRIAFSLDSARHLLPRWGRVLRALP